MIPLYLPLSIIITALLRIYLYNLYNAIYSSLYTGISSSMAKL
jgi:hypothetical protein